MAKYDYFQQSRKKDKQEIHPIWRGIGCITMILIPIISWAAAMVFLDYGLSHKWSFLYQLSGTVQLSSFIYRIAFFNVIANYISSIEYLKAKLIFFVIAMMLFSSIFAMLYAILYRLFGPPRYSTLDAPPPRVKPKKFTR